MAKRRTKELRARKQDAATRDDDSLLVQSAESLGRVIGSLQRQVQGSSKRVSAIADDAIAALPELPRFDDLFGGAGRSRKRTAARKSSLRGAKATRKTAGARKRAARKAPRARKTSGSRRRTGARKSSSSKR